MNIGIFTDTYFPQVSGVATSIKTLKNQLERLGHNVYIFTTTDPQVEKNVFERNIFRFQSVPFVSFTDRRIAFRGLFQSYRIAKRLGLDIVHTQTEFSMGLIGKMVAKALKIPSVHTYHTMYEDYLHYVAKGKLLKPYHVKYMTRSFLDGMTGCVAPSERVLDKLTSYDIDIPISVIPTGVDVDSFYRPKSSSLRSKYSLSENTPLILTLSRLAFEKDIDRLISAFPLILNKIPNAVLMICGDGPARNSLEKQAKNLGLSDKIVFTGEINNADVGQYYHMADVFVSTSVSESQGLTYIEALASKIPVIASHSPYTDELLDNKCLGATFSSQEELVNLIDKYLMHDIKSNDEILSTKLYAISADKFARDIVQFYYDSLECYAKKTSFSDSRERI